MKYSYYIKRVGKEAEKVSLQQLCNTLNKLCVKEEIDQETQAVVTTYDRAKVYKVLRQIRKGTTYTFVGNLDVYAMVECGYCKEIKNDDDFDDVVEI